MSQYPGVDLTAEAGEATTPFSWHTPHPTFVIILVGQEETPFGVQKDLLCTQSPYFRDLFNQEQWAAGTVEHVVTLPNYDIDIFGCFQNFIFSNKVYDGKALPSYQTLLGVWKLAVELRMAPLRVAVMDTMSERRTLTSTIPSTALLIQAWQETVEGSGLRLMLINWAAEHMRASPELRNTFAKSLPKEILSELVIIMAGLPVPVAPPQAIQQVSHQPTKPNTAKRENPLDDVPQYQGTKKRSRISAVATANEDDLEFKPKPISTPTITKKVPRKSQGGRRSTRIELNEESNPERDMAFCSDLITRMLSAPGFWTRLVAPFKNPVDPIADNVPNYFSVIKKPICLRDIKTKMDAGQYSTAQEFEADMRQIFSNCYEYWTQEDAIFKSCEQLEKSFNDKFAARDRWRGATIKAEVIED